MCGFGVGRSVLLLFAWSVFSVKWEAGSSAESEAEQGRIGEERRNQCSDLGQGLQTEAYMNFPVGM